MESRLSQSVLARLRCPVSRQPLHFEASPDRARFGVEFSEGAFVTQDGRKAYPVSNGFPDLRPESAREAPNS